MPERIPWSSLEFFSVLLPHKRRELLFLSSCFDSDWIRINFNNLKNHWLKIAQTRSFWPPPPQSRPPTSPSSSFPNIFEWCVHATLQPTWLEHNTRWQRMKKKKKKRTESAKDEKATSWKTSEESLSAPKSRELIKLLGVASSTPIPKKGWGETEGARPRRGRWFGRARSCQKTQTRSHFLGPTDTSFHFSLNQTGRRTFPEFDDIRYFSKNGFSEQIRIKK